MTEGHEVYDESGFALGYVSPAGETASESLEHRLMHALAKFTYESSTGRGTRGLMPHHIQALTSYLVGFIYAEISRESAAPIAPAAEGWKSFTISRIAAQNSLVREYLDKRDARLRKAEELIQELKKALEPFPGNPRFSDEDGDEWWCMCCDASARLGSEIKHDEDCMIGRAITALARAEEYRKGAKNG